LHSLVMFNCSSCLALATPAKKEGGYVPPSSIMCKSRISYAGKKWS